MDKPKSMAERCRSYKEQNKEQQLITLAEDDFIGKESPTNIFTADFEIKYYEWGREDGKVTKILKMSELDDAIDHFKQSITILKKHIFVKKETNTSIT